MPCIDETIEEADTAPLFEIENLNKLHMSRMEQLGVVLHNPTQESVCWRTYRSTRKEETSGLYTGSDPANFRHANIICDASDANKWC